ncbi:carboxyl-terminal processing protease [Tahibacter aquaticus]|uniref:Carboxyl-terminal processing protease n=1 Tax=Tahibacter aquaticus TaxID=520092 RepID=A0A4V3DNL9_9GAMM|nr:carboxy terminal-processing peptidase [Tahibacter aquaticus]TDR48926.1 carboxyl-terminal processing protease [Tahibacter aquaticus]
MRKTLIVLALLASGLALAKPSGQSGPLLKPVEDQAEAAIWASRFLTRFHYKAVPLDDAMSAKMFDAYFDSLDGEKLFFLKSDVDKFSVARDQLDDAIFNKDLSMPFAVFNLYLQRVAERTSYSRELLKKPFDLNAQESYAYDREKAQWAGSTAELDDLWRKRVKNDVLRLKLAGKKDDEIRKTLDKRYIGFGDRVAQINSEDVFQTFMNAYATSIEPHTNYLGPRASENFDISMKLSLEGIGAVLQREEEYTAIREIVPGGPAALSGKLKVGDRILGVGQGDNGAIADVIGWRLDDVVEQIRGQKDTVVRLEVLPADGGPDAKHQMLSLVRKKVSIEEQAAKKQIIEVKEGSATRRVGVIQLPTFYLDFDARRRGDKDYKSATRDTAKLLAELKAEKVDGVVIDLRNNGGGSLSEATELTGLFIDKGPVVQVRSAQGRVETEDDRQSGMTWDGPLAVMVNRGSASASEIFAAAIQDYGRGLIIGEPTFGKGTVQMLVDLDNAAQNEKPKFGELKMTSAQFFRINGGTTQLRGVVPDIAFPDGGEAKEFGESSYPNALPWSSITPASYEAVADLKPILPTLATRHEARVTKSKEWQYYAEDQAEIKRLRAEKTVSLNEAERRKERDEQEVRKKTRDAERAALDEASKSGVTVASANDDSETDVQAPSSDDGLQADERSIKSQVEREKAAKERKDVALDEAARILADEVGLIRADTKLAQQVLPQPGTHISVD